MDAPSPAQQASASQNFIDQQQQFLVAPVAQLHPPETHDISQITDPTKTSSSAFILGLHNYKALNDVDLPEFVKEHQATLTFPEKLMLMLTYVDKEYGGPDGKGTETASVSWILDGKAFTIRDKNALVKHLLPLFFRQAKFASFTRKLYRWGFRQVSMSNERIIASGSKREIVFGHEHFQRDNKPLMSKMRSVTAAGTRRAIAAGQLKQTTTAQHSLQIPDKLAIDPKYGLASVGTPSFVITTQPQAPTDLAGGLKLHTQQQPAQQHHQQQQSFMILPAGMTMAPAPGHQATTIGGIPIHATTQAPQQLIALEHPSPGAHQATVTSLQSALALSHPSAVSLPGVDLRIHPPGTEPNTGADPPAAKDAASDHAASTSLGTNNGYLPSLAQLGAAPSDPNQAVQQLQTAHSTNGGDSNAHMSAAIDMLLKSAKSAAPK